MSSAYPTIFTRTASYRTTHNKGPSVEFTCMRRESAFVYVCIYDYEYQMQVLMCARKHTKKKRFISKSRKTIEAHIKT